MKRPRCKWCDKMLAARDATICRACLVEFEKANGININHSKGE